MSDDAQRCPCGGIPYKYPPHLQAKREAMWKRGVEFWRHRADEKMPAWCATCIWRRITEGFDAKNDVNAAGGSA